MRNVKKIPLIHYNLQIKLNCFAYTEMKTAPTVNILNLASFELYVYNKCETLCLNNKQPNNQQHSNIIIIIINANRCIDRRNTMRQRVERLCRLQGTLIDYVFELQFSVYMYNNVAENCTWLSCTTL